MVNVFRRWDGMGEFKGCGEQGVQRFLQVKKFFSFEKGQLANVHGLGFYQSSAASMDLAAVFSFSLNTLFQV